MMVKKVKVKNVNQGREAVMKELEVIRILHGGMLRPEDVVCFAKERTESALHSRFQWNDGIAAHQYRLWQAREIIEVAVTIVPSVSGDVCTRAYVSLTGDRCATGGYRMIVDVVSDKALKARMIADALAELERVTTKYATLKELVPIKRAIDKAKRKIG